MRYLSRYNEIPVKTQTPSIDTSPNISLPTHSDYCMAMRSWHIPLRSRSELIVNTSSSTHDQSRSCSRHDMEPTDFVTNADPKQEVSCQGPAPAWRLQVMVVCGSLLMDHNFRRQEKVQRSAVSHWFSLPFPRCRFPRSDKLPSVFRLAQTYSHMLGKFFHLFRFNQLNRLFALQRLSI